MRVVKWLAVPVLLPAYAAGGVQSSGSTGGAGTGGGLPRLTGASGVASPGANDRPGPHPRSPVIVVGLPLGWWALGGGSLDATVTSDPPAAPRPAPATKVIEVAPPAGAGAIAAEPLDGGLLRVRWAAGGRPAREVTLLVADSARRVVASQTVYAAPYAAVFDGAARAAFVGVTVVQADGVSTTTLVPQPGAGATPGVAHGRRKPPAEARSTTGTPRPTRARNPHEHRA